MIFFEEYARAGAPGHGWAISARAWRAPPSSPLAPRRRKQKYLPGIVAGTELWCQGYSEPGAGSDLANVKTKARFDEAKGQVDTQWTKSVDLPGPRIRLLLRDCPHRPGLRRP